ncbi:MULTISPECIES: DUF4873 domain-containing protein [Micromonospora]|uniref:DUF4873 domain-containing protein n=1 Tax=Micromonospora chalcea TaxID=1874 RepID=A0ABX9YDZ1_MICCH|nr:MULTISPECIES: DUF4873 domain-containing protein [Micromonospora]MBQ1062339.1 DUF4873 domain-containing protein [Micromonospora sp. C41]ODB73908.1 DUF4873 domain-containing protein [Micromonospora sp. II]RQW98815.1 DUF4873 domain-containing protein [Micromonospora chalcea]
MTWQGTAEIAGTRVRLHAGGRFEPVDGRYHWAGRVEPEPRLVRLLRSGRRDVEIRIGERVTRARLTEVDPWGGVRITGVGTPPWPPEEE